MKPLYEYVTISITRRIRRKLISEVATLEPDILSAFEGEEKDLLAMAYYGLKAKLDNKEWIEGGS